MTQAARRERIWEPVVAVLLGVLFLGSALPPAWKRLNTDFPNYYLTARLVREHTYAAQAYEWMWIQREKDHRELDQRIVGLVPITPFSTLVAAPLARYPALTAKRIWIVLNLGLVIGIIFSLSRVSGLSVARTSALVACSYPLQFNLLLGQYYILLLALLTAGCWAAQTRRSTLCGALVGLAAALKIFPVILLFYFLRRRDWRAIASCLLTITASVCVSISVFGWEMHRTYLRQVLPWTLRGEGLPPFHLGSSSLSTVLHRLFLYEPQWNPHPAVNAAWLLPVLHATLQCLLLAPALLLLRKRNSSPRRTALEWSGILLVSLTLSTSPGSYLFTLLILPVAVVCNRLLRSRRFALLFFTIAMFAAAGWPDWHIRDRVGWSTLLCVPRLYALLALTFVALLLLSRKLTWRFPREELFWCSGIVLAGILGSVSALSHQQGLLDDYRYRLPMPSDVLLARQPQALGVTNVAYVGLTMGGYQATTLNPLPQPAMDRPTETSTDHLSLAVHRDVVWTESVNATSTLKSPLGSTTEVADAESPVFSRDGKCLTYLRAVRGHKEAFIRCFDQKQPERQLTTPPLNVYETAFLADDELIISASHGDNSPSLYRLDLTGKLIDLLQEESRYPAVSPDGRWLAFSTYAAGNWNLQLLDLASGRETPISRVPCNQLDPAWEPDSKTLLYASDCGRALWFTALARRRVIP